MRVSCVVKCDKKNFMLCDLIVKNTKKQNAKVVFFSVLFDKK